VTPSSASLRAVGSAFDVERVRAEFPALRQSVRGRPLVYLDSTASTLRCRAAIAAVDEFLSVYPANVHRGVHQLAERATAAYEDARAVVARFLHAGSSNASAREVVFVRGTTEAINLVAWSFARPRLQSGDEVLVTTVEHHSNLVPWQLVCAERGARLVVASADERGDVAVESFAERLGPRTRLVALAHTSNSLGSVLPVAAVARLARERGIPVVVDGAQAVPHGPVDLGALGCDFFAFSGHKVFAPNGIGVLWGREELLREMAPYQGGGGMIRSVDLERGTTYADPPERFEAGTPNVEGAIGLAAALRWLDTVGMEAVAEHEEQVVGEAVRRLGAEPGVRLIGRPRRRAGIVSFTLDGVHPHDVATVLDSEGVAVRAGHHCAQPVMAHFGVPATVRSSFALYSTEADVDALVAAVRRARELFAS
jgi:cysteine desulfurase/selenocysteine lyase